MMMPSEPASCLVLSHSTLIFGILKWTFHPVSLRLHECQPFCRSIKGGIAQTVFFFFWRFYFTSYHQMPSSSFSFLAVPKPNKFMQNIDKDRAVPNSGALPGTRGLLFDPGINPALIVSEPEACWIVSLFWMLVEVLSVSDLRNRSDDPYGYRQ